jgi:hypothetical protein
MATQAALKQLAQTAQQQQSQVLLPEFPRLSVYSPKLAQIDPQGIQAYETAIATWLKNATFNIQQQPVG